MHIIGDVEHELFGHEDVSILYAYIAYLPSKVAYKEVIKFRRRLRFLEFFTYTAQKALNEGYPDVALSWCEETENYIIKRNEPFTNVDRGASTQPTQSAAKGWNAAVTEYSQTIVSPNSKTTTSKGGQTKRRKPRYKPIGIDPNLSESQKALKEEQQFKAFDTFANHLPNMWRTHLRRKRLRKICTDEMPWRSEMHHVQAKCLIKILIRKLETIEQIHLTYTDLDNEWYGFENLGEILIINPAKKKSKGKGNKTIELTAIDLAAAAASSGKLFWGDEQTGNVGAPGVSSNTPSNKKEKVSLEYVEESLKSAYNYFCKSIILAHRGRHWILLQNICRSLWNYSSIILQYSSLRFKNIKQVMNKAFFMATDCLLDMLLSTQGENVDIEFLQKTTLRTLELLSLVEKWECLVHVGLKFCALTNNVFDDQVKPLIACAQNQLINRITSSGGCLENSSRITTTNDKDYLNLELNVKFGDKKDLAELIGPLPDAEDKTDPNSNSVWAKRLCRVPLNIDKTMESLKLSLDRTEYTTRALRHSRRLLSLYLAGKVLRLDDELKPKSADSRVDFVKQTSFPPDAVPPNLEVRKYRNMTDVHCNPLPSSQLSLVRESYRRTIELLLASKQKHLAAQALRDLGNLEMHSNNNNKAAKYWNEALGILTGYENLLKVWRKEFAVNDLSEFLLKKYGIWICLLSANLISNIAQFNPPSKLREQTDHCLLASFFFKSVFRASLPHPLADRDYAIYEIGIDKDVENLIPGIDILADRYRLDGSSLISSLKFTIDVLVESRYLLMTLPLLTLHTYLTTFIAPEARSAIAGRLTKVKVLTDLHMFSEAIHHLLRVLYGEDIPDICGIRIFEISPPKRLFSNSKSLSNIDNLKLLDLILDKRLASNQASAYGSYLTCQVNIVQAHLLIEIASTVQGMPIFEDDM